MHIAPIGSSLSVVRRGSYVATVVGREWICREHFRLSLRVKNFPASVPGQFIQLQGGDEATADEPKWIDWSPGQSLPELHGAVEEHALLNRPFSIALRRNSDSRGNDLVRQGDANRAIPLVRENVQDRPTLRRDDDDSATLSVIIRTVGVASRYLSNINLPSQLSLIGPLGVGFTPPSAGVTPLLVGGGVGIPPMIYCASEWGAGRAIAFCGAMSRDLLSLTMTGEPDARGIAPTLTAAEFAEWNVPVVITSDDGSIGRRGLVTAALRDWLSCHRDTPAKIYTCGPEPMLKAVAALAAEFHTPCEVAVERAMACGLGTCQSCVIRVRDGEGWKYKLSCTDGPVFDATKLLW